MNNLKTPFNELEDTFNLIIWETSFKEPRVFNSMLF